jgi:hypothetical protein
MEVKVDVSVIADWIPRALPNMGPLTKPGASHAPYTATNGSASHCSGTGGSWHAVGGEATNVLLCFGCLAARASEPTSWAAASLATVD